LAKLETKDYGKLKTEQRINNGELEYEISEDLERGFFFGPSRKREFDGKFTTILPVKLEINSGATNFDLDLSKLKVESLNLNTGASNGQIVFGKNVALVKASVKTGASKIEIKVPKGTGVKLRYNVNGLNNRDFAPGLNLNRESDDRYVSKDYETAANKIELDIDAGVSNIQIVEY
jgi:hypothetical protein